MKNSSEVEEEEEAQDHHDGTKKSYDCTFCRRGFTNAQALGGHMNIHRRDRAKNKPHLLHHSPNSSNNNHQEGEFMSLKFSSSSTHAFDSQRTYDNMYFHPPPPPPPNDYQVRNHQQHEPPFQLDQFHHQPMMNLKNQELQGANLSLQICPTSDDQHVIRRRIHQQDSDEVDLELRLGHHHP
ncbi:hypothetical protein HN51_028632 [Arachis hypogaea]|uniref:C2H2-type domain-containing protein n=1 Tax=Arachis hypogaea TaxID=3818 RepID=A0A445BI02_ARAHY|nr:transcriptional regulator TAC1-like [Arachis hypogaea]QHO35145.1 Transcriptional regulator [Arachis hypogaea]RYR38312.1 hypothetical protein Ahy_A09g043322 [Arachis hypogaea]